MTGYQFEKAWRTDKALKAHLERMAALEKSGEDLTQEQADAILLELNTITSNFGKR